MKINVLEKFKKVDQEEIKEDFEKKKEELEKSLNKSKSASNSKDTKNEEPVSLQNK